MALIHCAECKKEISSTAAACPYCGYTAPKPTRSSPVGFILALLILSVGLTFLVGLLWGGGFFVLFGLIGAVVMARRKN